MKKTILFGSAVLLFLTACETTRFVPYSDDVYANSVKDKKMAELALEAKAKRMRRTKKGKRKSSRNKMMQIHITRIRHTTEMIIKDVYLRLCFQDPKIHKAPLSGATLPL